MCLKLYSRRKQHTTAHSQTHARKHKKTEAEHRSTFYIPYWNVPLLRALVPRQRQFAADLVVINDCLDGLIRAARESRSEDDADALQARDYANVSLLDYVCVARFSFSIFLLSIFSILPAPLSLFLI